MLDGDCSADGAPYRALRDIVSRYRRQLHELGLADDVLLAELEEVSGALGMPSFDALDADRGPSTATEQVQFFERLGALLARCAALLPGVLVFRDLHLADRATLSAVEYLLGHVFTDPVRRFAPSGGRVGGFKGTVVVTMSERGAAFSRVREALGEHEDVTWLSLQDVEESAVRRFVESDEVVARLLSISGGSPDNLADLLAALPDRVEDLFLRRVERLDASSRRLLEALSVWGYPVSPDVALRVTDDADAPPSLAALVEQRLLARHVTRGALLVSLPSDANAAALYAQIPRARRKALHGRVASLLAQRAGLGEPVDDARIAHHFLRSEQIGPALKHALFAAERLHIGFAYERAREVLEELAPHVEDAADRVQIYERLVELCAALHAWEDALTFCAQLADAAPLEAQASILRRQAEILQKTGSYEEALQRVDSARTLAEDHVAAEERTLELVKLLSLEAEARYGMGSYDQARRCAESGLELAESLDVLEARREAIHLNNTVGKVQLFLGAHEEARACFVTNERAAASLGWAEEEVRALFNQATTALQRRNYADAERAFEACRDRNAHMSNPVMRAFVQLNLAVVYQKTGRWEPAVDAYLNALATFQRTGNELQFAVAAMNLGSLYETVGEYVRARELLALSLDVTQRREIRYFEGRTHYILGHLCLAEGVWDEAESCLERAASCLEETGSHTFPELIAIAQARAAHGVGDTPRRDALMQRAAPQEGDESADEVAGEWALYAAWFALDDGDPAAALEHAAAAALHFEAMSASERLWRSHYVAGLAHAALGQLDAASASLSASVDRMEQRARALSGSLRQRYLSDPLRRRVRDAIEAVRTGKAPRLPTASVVESGEQVQDEAFATWRQRYARIVGEDERLMQIFRLIDRVSESDSTVLILGESGTGKELIAEAIHAQSKRKNGPFVKVNCAAFVETLLHSELFGHEKGAFTGALTQKLGRFELASGGTLFLDEIGDISPNTQVALLRVLQERTFERVGGSATVSADVRLICATNRALEDMVKAGTFRLDLYYRLKGVLLELPPLHARRADIPGLVRHFCERFAPSGGAAKRFSREAMARLVCYSWPGNVRELENFVRSVLLFVDGERVRLDDVRQFDDFFAGGTFLQEPPPFFAEYEERAPAPLSSPAPTTVATRAQGEATNPESIARWALSSGVGLPDLKRTLERELIRQALVECDANISKAAQLLEMKRPRLSQIVNSTPELASLRDALLNAQSTP